MTRSLLQMVEKRLENMGEYNVVVSRCFEAMVLWRKCTSTRWLNSNSDVPYKARVFNASLSRVLSYKLIIETFSRWFERLGLD